MSVLEPGLVQAINRLAYEIRRAQDEVDQPIIRDNPWVLELSNAEIVDFLTTRRTRDEQERWDLIAEIEGVVCDTYGVDPDHLNELVEYSMGLQDAAEELR